MRMAAGCASEDLARILDLSSEEYARIEADPDSMTIQQARSLCAALRCTIDDLFPFEGGGLQAHAPMA